MTVKATSSPTATGGSGTYFEQHVGAFFLALLLVRAIPPVLQDCQVEEVHFQTEIKGWNTDDILVVGAKGENVQRNLAVQVKRSFTISESDEECVKAFSDFWEDFASPDRLNPEVDRLALVVLRGTNLLLGDFNSLLDCARAASDSDDFSKRLAAQGYLSKAAKNQAGVIRNIVRNRDSALSDDAFWQFLKVLHVLSYDLNTSTAQSEAIIKSLLAQTANGSEPASLAGITWNELLKLLGTGIPTASSYKRASLPDGMRHRHSDLALDQGALLTLKRHSETTMDRVKATLGHSKHLQRTEFVANTLKHLDESQIVVVTGPAGAGKSVVAKDTFSFLEKDHLCLAFRAEEFAYGHFDSSPAFAGLSTHRLMALLAGQSRKVILVDSVERLLEAQVREAFTDLLLFAQKDRSIQLLITCRDYSLETVRSALLERVPITPAVVTVPPLSDDELEQAEQDFPKLTSALSDVRLKRLLRSPYLLDYAVRMDWSSTDDLPRDERDFRARCWKEVIRKESSSGSGMPRRREQAFLEIALRRARELRPYVPCGDLDSEAVETLLKDDLISAQEDSDHLVAPSHDVLEDWAIIHWLNTSYKAHEGNVQSLAQDIGGYPAFRRSYRKWLDEMMVCEPEQAAALVVSVLESPTLPAFFRDDTLVSMLLSQNAAPFLTTHVETLLADDGHLITRVIHLLRVACKMPFPGFPSVPSSQLQFLVPQGDAWPAVLKIVSDSSNWYLPKNLDLVLGLIEDWSKSVTWHEPYPSGFVEAGKIAYRLLPYFDGYSRTGRLDRTLEVLVKVPKADAVAFKDLLERASQQDHGDHVAVECTKLLLTGISAGAACRDFPEEVVQLAMANFCLTDADVSARSRHEYSSEIEPFFGIRPYINLDHFPASALRGPFQALLWHHPDKGVDFIIALLNHACSWYGEQRYPSFRLEPALSVELQVSNEKIVQWANHRLWQLYRGTSVGPYVLQSALMALESWLLAICERDNWDVESWLTYILKQSNNVALTSVVSSVCQARYVKSGSAAIAVLTAQDLFELDRARQIGDLTDAAGIGLLPYSRTEHEIFLSERKQAAALQHRKSHLENLAVQLQLTERREEVWQLLDDYAKDLPPLEEQTTRHRLWRLALHRMDVRAFEVIADDKLASDPDHSPVQNDETTIYLGPGQVEADIQELLDSFSADQADHQIDLALLNWGCAAWEGSGTGQSNREDWRSQLTAAKQRSLDPHTAKDYAAGGPGFIAAVCVRDRWEEMGLDDQGWCVSRLIYEVELYSQTEEHAIRVGRGGLRPDRAAANILPHVLEVNTDEGLKERLISAIACALTHPVEEVAQSAAEGVGYYLKEHRDFALRCAFSLAGQPRLIDDLQRNEALPPYFHGENLLLRVAPKVRTNLVSDGASAHDLESLDLDKWYGRHAASQILRILSYRSELPHAHQFFSRVVSWLVQQWEAERADRSSRRNRHYEFEHECLARAAKFVLDLPIDDARNVCNPLLGAINDFPDKVADFVTELICVEDQRTGDSPFWGIWQELSDGVFQSPWLVQIDSEYSSGAKLIRALFLGVSWKRDARHWSRLNGNTGLINNFFSRLPASACVLEAYCQLLFHIGEQFMPDAFVAISERLYSGESKSLLGSKNTMFYIEALLRRYVYGEPLRLKLVPKMRLAVIKILDDLVEVGSPAAFKMRDDFVTPIGKS